MAPGDDGPRMTGQERADLAREAAKLRTDFDGVECYCMFVGYPRSGHSLIGSLLDAHPDMIIAHELDALKYVEAGLDREQLFYLLLDNSRRFTEQGRVWQEYSYQVKNQWQGRFRTLRVIGDKKGGLSSVRLRRNPKLLDELRRSVGTRIKFIHVVRNPFDNISTISRKDAPDLQQAVPMYFGMAQASLQVQRQTPPEDFIEIRHETFLEDPAGRLRELCRFLGRDAPEDYVRDCAAIVAASPHKSRSDAPWTPQLIERVRREMKPFPFLDGYSYEA